MFSVVNLLWTPLSISYLVQLILVSILAGYFLRRLWQDLHAGKGVGALVVTFVALFLDMLFQFLKVSAHPDYSAYFLAWISPAGALAVCGFAVFAHQFPAGKSRNPVEISLVLGLSIAFVGLEIIVAVARHMQLMQGYVEYRPAWMDLPFVIGFIYVIISFLRQMVNAIATEQNLDPRPAFRIATAAILWPGNPLGRASTVARAFFYVSCAPLLLVLILLLRSYGLMGPILAEIAACWTFLLALSGFALVYLNYVPERSTFQVKLVGITLTTVLSILSGVAWIIGPLYIASYENTALVEAQTILRFEPNSAGGYRVTRPNFQFETSLGQRIGQSSAAIDLPFAFPYFGASYATIYTGTGGFVGFEATPLWRDISHRFGAVPAVIPMAVALDPATLSGADDPRGLFVNKTEDRVLVTWNRFTAASGGDNKYTVQLALFRDGVIEFRYKDLPAEINAGLFVGNQVPMGVGITPGHMVGPLKSVVFKAGTPLQSAAGTGLIENYRLDFLLYLDRIYAPIARFILAASLLIMIVFPMFFRINLDRPLARLLQGVQQFRKGDLSIVVPVAYRDEIGFLTHSFNAMAEAQNDLIQTLEDKVTKRTAEVTGLAVENARLEERNHLSRELHDAVSQTLFSANLIGDTLPDLWQGDPARAELALAEMRQLNRNALFEMRHLLLELRPAKIYELPFGELLQEIANNFERQNKVTTKIQIDNDLILPGNVQITFYRIAQECLSNIAKHAEANTVDLYFDGVAAQAMLVIKDNGKGFDVGRVPPGHMGLQIMKERVEKLGGSLEIETAPGKGMSLTLIWFRNDAD